MQIEAIVMVAKMTLNTKRMFCCEKNKQKNTKITVQPKQDIQCMKPFIL